MDLVKNGIHKHLNLVSKMVDELKVENLIDSCFLKEGILEKLGKYERIFLVGVGKVSNPMINHMINILPSSLKSVINITNNDGLNFSNIENCKSTHPYCSELSHIAASKLISFLNHNNLGEKDVIIFAISGGTSAMLLSPTPYLKMEQLKLINHSLINSGLNVSDMNRVRKAISTLHGGGILEFTNNADIFSFILSDNAQNDVESVGSGLTYEYDVKDTEIKDILFKLNIETDLKRKILNSHLYKKKNKIYKKCNNHVIADVNFVSQYMKNLALRNEYKPIILNSNLDGDVNDVADYLMTEYSKIIKKNILEKKYCIISSGEITVKVKGKGRGGRCQELAWNLSKKLNKFKKNTSFIAFSTDGNDYIPGVAGAWATNESHLKIKKLGLDWNEILEDNNSNYGLEKCSQLIKNINTSLNLCDLYVLFVE